MIESDIKLYFPHVLKAERITGSAKMRGYYNEIGKAEAAYFKVGGVYIKAENCIVESINQEVERLDFTTLGGRRVTQEVPTSYSAVITLRCYGKVTETEDLEINNFSKPTRLTLDNFSDEELRKELEKRSKNKKIEKQVKNGVRILNLES